MKCRKFLIAAAICGAAACAALTGCGSDAAITAEQTIAEMAGTYQWSYITDGTEGYTPEEMLTELQKPTSADYIRPDEVEKVRALMAGDGITLKEDGTGTLTLQYFCGDGPLTCSWARNGDTITLDCLVWGLDPQLTLNVQGNDLVLEFPDTEYVLTFTKS